MATAVTHTRSKIAVSASAFAAFAVLAIWCLHLQQSLHQQRVYEVRQQLQPVLALLQEDDQILAELNSADFKEQDNDVLGSFLVRVRRDGVARNAHMKSQLDRLAENNTTIAALLNAYSPMARSADLRARTSQFVEYQAAWRDRWNSVMELFMAGGSYAAAGPVFPDKLSAAVVAEIGQIG